MLRLISRLFAIWIILTIAACGSGEADQDIPPVATSIPPAEAQTAPEITATPELQPALATEFVEPISPVSPAAQPEMPLTDRSAQPIPGSEDALAAVVADLSEQTGIPVSEITLVSMETMEWSDASLGCPQEGFMYAQVITPGYLMILEAGGKQYEYHTDQATNFILCEA